MVTSAIMQPYLFPYIGYWQLINAVDIFVIYDNIQFSKKGWFHRNNILLNNKKTLFSIPLKKDSDNLNVVERYISNSAEKEIRKIIRQIEAAYKKSPQFNQVFPFVKDIFLNDEKNLFKYIYNSVNKVCEFLGIETKIQVSSTINIDHSLKSQAKVLAINKALNATKYINPIGGKQLYDFKGFNKEGIELNFLESELPEYKQFQEEFIPYLSIIDIMMFNSKDVIRKMLDKYKLRGFTNV